MILVALIFVWGMNPNVPTGYCYKEAASAQWVVEMRDAGLSMQDVLDEVDIRPAAPEQRRLADELIRFVYETNITSQQIFDMINNACVEDSK